MNRSEEPLSVAEVKQAISCMKYLREYIVLLCPDKFYGNENPNFLLVIEEVKALITRYYNLISLIED